MSDQATRHALTCHRGQLLLTNLLTASDETISDNSMIYASSLTQENQNRMVEKCLHACTSERKAHHVSPSVTSVINSAPQNGSSWSHHGHTKVRLKLIMSSCTELTENKHSTRRLFHLHTPRVVSPQSDHRRSKTAPLSERVIAVTTQEAQVVRTRMHPTLKGTRC